MSRRRVLAGAGAVVAVLILLGFYLGAGDPPPDHVVVLIAEKTTRSPGVLAGEVRKHLHQVADRGGGQLVTYAVGDRSYPLEPVKLAVQRGGSLENDPRRRATAIDERLDALAGELDRAPVGRDGFSLAAALQAAAAESSKTAERIEVWLQTTVLSSSSDPLRVSTLIAADPKAAVQAVIEETDIATLDLSRVDLYPVLVTPVGDDQEPLTLAGEEWRKQFITELGTALKADVHDPITTSSAGPTWHDSSTVPPIVTEEDPTPVLAPDPDGQVPEVIDTAAFAPNTATLLDPAATQPKITRMATRYEQANRRYPIEVKGFTAAFGDAESSRVLSRERAAVIGDLLAAAGVPRNDIRTLGAGFDERADPTKDPRSAAQRVVIIRLLPSGS